MQKSGNAKNKSFRNGAMGGAALAVLAAMMAGGIFSRSEAGGENAGPMTIDGTYRVVTTPDAGEPAAETSKGALDPHVMSEPARRAAAGLALSGLLSGMIGLFGPNRLLNLLVAFGKRLGRMTAKVAEKPVQAAVTVAKATTKATARLFRKPGQLLLIFAGLTIFTFTGISLMDVEWQAGLIAGAGIAGATMYGVKKTGEAFGDLANKISFPKVWQARPARAAAA